MTFTFVSLYVQFDEKKNEEYFFKLANLNFPIILFIDVKYNDKVGLFEKYKNITIKLFNWSKIPYNKYISDNNLILDTPSKIIKIKDILEGNLKAYFLLESKKLINKYEQYVWINFDILKITDDLEHFKENFSKLKNHNKIIIPGSMKEKKELNENELMKEVYTRFFGSIIICPSELVEKFSEDYDNIFNTLLKKSKVTWEVNILANIEANNDYIQHYRASNNKSLFGFNDIKIILLSMIKNEEKIIQRCINSVLKICDAFCVSDTMSTDSTVEIVNKYITEHSEIPGKIYQNEWSDFGTNRTISYNNTVDFCKELGWDQELTYGLLLDADMKLIVNNSFKKKLLNQNGYKIIQDNGSIDYQNIRFIKLNETWKCTGVTHEYWDGPDSGLLEKEIIYIQDIGDGGCKNDKFERDMRLLIKGIEDDPQNGRYHFYLAQTCKDLGKFKESIKLYKRRIEIGGWDEEVWYSYYMIAKNFISLGDINKAELWANRAYEFRKSRPEPLYLLCNLFRERGQNFKAYHYYKLGKDIPESNDALFVEKNISKYLLEYENTILHYWIYDNRLDGLKKIVDYLNKHKHYEQNVINNMDFYLEKIPYESISPLLISDNDNYCVSSPCIIKYNNKNIVNLRYVNYRIQPDGSYKMYDNGTFSNNNFVKTRNAMIYLDSNYKIITEPMFFDDSIKDIQKQEDSWIKGLEDIRLIEFKNKIYYIAASKEYTYSNTIRMVFGEYNINNLKYENNKILIPPTETECEKNWIPLNHKDSQILFIYNWHPLQIGVLDDKNKLNIFIKYDTPTFFKHYRGSSNVVTYNNQLWMITHGVKYVTPRKYYHQFVVLEKETYKPIKYTVPFYFKNYKIEYCVGLLIENDEAIIMFSQNDKDASMINVKINKLDNLFINI
jgi:hypothetical protein